ncbi:MAG: hypothetical protein JW912_01855 [Sedimentisphaerales bacterium]|nr:hypothetical protein [Sedimentisphaerales bacterium]
MEKRTCKKCNRVLVLDHKNFRKSKGYYVHTCRECDRAEKRYLRGCGNFKVKSGKDIGRVPVESLVKKYDKVFTILDEHSIDYRKSTMSAADVDRILEKGKKFILT